MRAGRRPTFRQDPDRACGTVSVIDSSAGGDSGDGGGGGGGTNGGSNGGGGSNGTNGGSGGSNGDDGTNGGNGGGNGGGVGSSLPIPPWAVVSLATLLTVVFVVL